MGQAAVGAAKVKCRLFLVGAKKNYFYAMIPDPSRWVSATIGATIGCNRAGPTLTESTGNHAVSRHVAER